jgi:hypothetical protein
MCAAICIRGLGITSAKPPLARHDHDKKNPGDDDQQQYAA